MHYRLRCLATAGLFLLVSACGANDILTGSPINDDGRIRSSAVYVAATGQFPTVIRGNPSNLGGDAFRDVVLGVLRLPAGLPATVFTVEPDPPVPHAYRLVLVFAPENKYLSARTICSGEADIPVSRAKDKLLFLKAVYCHRSAPLSETFGQTAITDYRGEKFRTLMFLVMEELFPPDQGDADDCIRRRTC
ncbi:MAG: hypothetical protein IID55_06585 [Proteobacteria bacterium]|nr:hypothetical protein [Pseudomonadota bacterium]